MVESLPVERRERTTDYQPHRWNSSFTSQGPFWTASSNFKSTPPGEQSRLQLRSSLKPSRATEDGLGALETGLWQGRTYNVGDVLGGHRVSAAGNWFLLLRGNGTLCPVCCCVPQQGLGQGLGENGCGCSACSHFPAHLRRPPCSDLGPTDESNSELGRVCVTSTWVFKTLKNVQQNVNSYLWGSETMGESLLLLYFLKIYYLNFLSWTWISRSLWMKTGVAINRKLLTVQVTVRSRAPGL